MDRQLKNTLLRAIIPALIGVGVVVWLFIDDFDSAVLENFQFGWHTACALVASLIFVIGRDFGLTWRFRTITDGAITWRRALKTDLMCAFTSAITPSAVGGSALAVFYLNREGISVGRATTLTLTTLFLDELFFVVFCPLLVLLLPIEQLFGSGDTGMFLHGVEIVFWIVYAGIVIYTVFLYIGILARPEMLSRFVVWLFGLRLLRRWQGKARQMMDNLVATSQWVRGRPCRWWLKVFGATTLSWFSRYFVVSALFWGFVPSAPALLVFGRQFVVWVVLMVSPTPGGSGISEWLFANYYGDIIGSASIAVVMAMVWRILSYYIYLLAGACLAPSYFNRKT